MLPLLEGTRKEMFVTLKEDFFSSRRNTMIILHIETCKTNEEVFTKILCNILEKGDEAEDLMNFAK